MAGLVAPRLGANTSEMQSLTLRSATRLTVALTLFVVSAAPALAGTPTERIREFFGSVNRVIGDPGDPVYAMLLEVTLPGSVDHDHLEAELGALAEELCVESNLHPADVDIL
mgnify:CR=1 FL=1